MAMALSIAKRVLFIVAIVSCVAMLIIIGEYYRGTGALVIGQQQVTNSVGILLWMGQYIGNQVSALTEYHLACLGNYIVQTQQGRTRARQSMNFAGAGFNGGMLTFKRASDTDVTSDFLMFPTDQPIFEYNLVFDSGLQSEISSDNKLDDLDEETIQLMGAQYNILDARINTGSDTVTLRLMGAGGLVELTDNYADTSFNQGVEVNGRSVNALIQIIGSESGNNFGIYNIKYRPIALHEIDVPPRHGLKGSMDEPEKLLNPQFNIFYTGLRAGGPSVPVPRRATASGPGTIKIRPVGDDEYKIDFTTKEGGYSIPLVSLRGGLVWGDKEDRNFVFKENVDINTNDYFMVSTGTDINDRTNILVYEMINFDGGVLYIKDWNGGNKREVRFDSSGKGVFLAAGHEYQLQVDMGNPAHPIRVGLTGGSIGSATAQAVLNDGTRLQFSGSGTVKHIAPRRLFENRNTDEVSEVQISQSGGDLNMVVTSPSLVSSEQGIKEGMTEFGVRFVYDKDHTPQTLTMYLPGSQSSAAVSIGGGLGFSTGTGQSEAGILVTCEENVLQQQQMQQAQS